jgi:hypothetical protein
VYNINGHATAVEIGLPLFFFAPAFLFLAPLVIRPVVFLTVVPALIIFTQEENLPPENLG